MLGEFSGTVDSKRRLGLPSKLRETLGLQGKKQEVILTRGLDGCLWLLTDEQWQGVEQGLKDLRKESFGFGSKETRAFLREFYRRKAQCKIDSHGRVLLPESLMKLHGVVKDVLFIVWPERTEIWAAEHDPEFDAYDQTAEALFG